MSTAEHVLLRRGRRLRHALDRARLLNQRAEPHRFALAHDPATPSCRAISSLSFEGASHALRGLRT